LMTTAVDLDALLNTYTSFLAQGGNDLLTNPFLMLIPHTAIGKFERDPNFCRKAKIGVPLISAEGEPLAIYNSLLYRDYSCYQGNSALQRGDFLAKFVLFVLSFLFHNYLTLLKIKR